MIQRIRLRSGFVIVVEVIRRARSVVVRPLRQAPLHQTGGARLPRRPSFRFVPPPPAPPEDPWLAFGVFLSLLLLIVGALRLLRRLDREERLK